MTCLPENDPSFEECTELRNSKARIAALQQRMQNVERLLGENTKITENINLDTKAILEAFQTLRGGVRIVKILGEIFKWATGIVVGAVSCYYLIKDHKIPWHF